MGLLIIAQLVYSARSTFFCYQTVCFVAPRLFCLFLLPFEFFLVLFWVQFPLVTIIPLREVLISVSIPISFFFPF